MLDQLDPAAQPSIWAQLQVDLAHIFFQDPFGNRADNLERAIWHYKHALMVYTRQAFPVCWAAILTHLAAAYANRIKGERADNLEQAIFHFQQALEVRTRADFPADWAETQNNLANAYADRIKGERADNLEQAIFHYQQALEVYTKEDFRAPWAMIQNNLADAYANRIRGSRADNLERAIYHYKQSLEIRKRIDFPLGWATTQHNLANAYANRIKGSRIDNIEQAISHYQQALEVYTPTYPMQWAMIQSNLGNAYQERIRRGRAENIEQALEYFNKSLQIYTRQAAPHEWAGTIMNLANAYSNRIRGKQAENIEQAIHHYQQALEVYTPQAAPLQWAGAMMNLANAYSNRIRGERADNLEQAIQHFQQALQVYTRQAFPNKWAVTLNNLATAYTNRIRGERADNLEQAIEHFEQALQVYTRPAFPREWAMTLHNLARAYRNRIRGERAENIERAIFHYQQALDVYTHQALPYEWAVTMMNLASAYLYRIRGEQAENIEEAISCAKLALQVYTRQALPYKWAGTLNNLATAYTNRIRGERADNLEQAIAHFQQALQVYTPWTWPQRCRDTAFMLGGLLYDEGRFGEARQALVTTHEAVEALRSEVTREMGKRDLSKENADLYARLVYCCLVEGDENAAFEYVAASKGRAFVDLLASIRFDLSATGTDDPDLAADLLQAREFRQQIDNLLTRLTSYHDSQRNNEQRKREQQLLRDLQRQELQLWEELAYKYPALTATQSAPSLSALQAQALAAELDATLVEFVQHAGGWSAFVVTPETVRHVLLDGVNDVFLERKVIGWLNGVNRPTGRSRLSYRSLYLWYKALIMPIKPYLPPESKIVLAPAGVLHLMPFSIARNPDTKRYFCDEYTVSFTPSLAALRVTFHKAKQSPGYRTVPQSLLTVAYPGKRGSRNYLVHTIPEAEAIAAHFPHVTQLHDKAATPQAVIDHAKGKDVVHVSGHAIFDLQQAEQSGMALHNGHLTAQRIITELQLEGTRLATLSACLTHRADPRIGEEPVGLTQAVMIAGAQTVVASLWAVQDQSTRVLFEQFYKAMAAGESPPRALQQAMRYVRQQPRWEHPYYWAGFQVSGLAHDMPAWGE